MNQCNPSNGCPHSKCPNELDISDKSKYQTYSYPIEYLITNNRCPTYTLKSHLETILEDDSEHIDFLCNNKLIDSNETNLCLANIDTRDIPVYACTAIPDGGVSGSYTFGCNDCVSASDILFNESNDYKEYNASQCKTPSTYDKCSENCISTNLAETSYSCKEYKDNEFVDKKNNYQMVTINKKKCSINEKSKIPYKIDNNKYFRTLKDCQDKGCGYICNKSDDISYENCSLSYESDGGYANPDQCYNYSCIDRYGCKMNDTENCWKTTKLTSDEYIYYLKNGWETSVEQSDITDTCDYKAYYCNTSDSGSDCKCYISSKNPDTPPKNIPTNDTNYKEPSERFSKNQCYSKCDRSEKYGMFKCDTSVPDQMCKLNTSSTLYNEYDSYRYVNNVSKPLSNADFYNLERACTKGAGENDSDIDKKIIDDYNISFSEEPIACNKRCADFSDSDFETTKCTYNGTGDLCYKTKKLKSGYNPTGYFEGDNCNITEQCTLDEATTDKCNNIPLSQCHPNMNRASKCVYNKDKKSCTREIPYIDGYDRPCKTIIEPCIGLDITNFNSRTDFKNCNLDVQVKQLQKQITANASNIKNNKRLIDINVSNIEKNSASITSNVLRINELEKNIVKINASIAKMNEDIGENSASITKLEKDIHNINASITKMENDIEINSASITSNFRLVNDRIDDNVESIKKNIKHIKKLRKRFKALKQKESDDTFNLNSQIQHLKNYITSKVFVNFVAFLKKRSDINKLQSNVKELQTFKEQYESITNTLSANVDINNENLSQLLENTQTNKDKIADIIKNKDDLTEKINNLNESVENLQTNHNIRNTVKNKLKTVSEYVNNIKTTLNQFTIIIETYGNDGSDVSDENDKPDIKMVEAFTVGKDNSISDYFIEIVILLLLLLVLWKHRNDIKRIINKIIQSF